MKAIFLLFRVSLMFVAMTVTAQLTVDATGPVHGRLREPTSGSGGGIGRKLPILLAIETHGSSPDESGRTLVEFILNNSGKEEIALPISPNSGDFEPEDARSTYTVTTLSLYVTSDKAQASPLAGHINLYGSNSISGTLAKLKAGQSVRVLARVAFPQVSTPPDGSFVFVGHARLENETVKPVAGQIVSIMKEIGSSTSSEYSPSALLGVQAK